MLDIVRQAIDYVLDTNGIVQVVNAVLRPIDETGSGDLSHQFVLVVRADNLNITTYPALVAGEYDGEFMNKLATNPDTIDPQSVESGDDLIQLITETPGGIEQTEPNGWPSSWEHPIFGYGPLPDPSCIEWQEQNPECNCLVWIHFKYTKGKKYFLGIKVKDFESGYYSGHCP